jgi:hypothetical protein
MLDPLFLPCLLLLAPRPPAQVTATPEPPLTYPTYEPFVSTPMFEVLFEDLEHLDLSALAEQVGELSGIKVHSRGPVEPVTGDDAQPLPSARLSPELPAGERTLYVLLPVVMMKLEPLWGATNWTPEQVTLAKSAATIVGRIEGAPALVFEERKPAENQAALERLVRWFKATATRPECCAAMIFSLDAGPYAGRVFETDEALPAAATQRIDEHLELRLCKVERPAEPCVLQLFRDGALVWSRVLSGAPDGAISEAVFTSQVQALGAYGWRVPFKTRWSHGVDQGQLYLDADGDLLFYSVAW